uniref:TIL domain containing protein n=1 Tax=Rhipicephalus appendiculatus TaxID=34631 RepID=A0A131YQR3_RHIAP
MAALCFAAVLSVFVFLQVSDGGRIFSPTTLQAIIDEPGFWWPGPIWPRPWPPHKRCRRPNEVYKECVSGSCAEMKCGMKRVPLMCTADCRYGCFCRDGYYRNQWGQCVTERQCKAYCSWNSWNPWYPWNSYCPGLTTRPSTYPEIYGP